MFRARIYAQGFTIAAMVAGSYYWQKERDDRKAFETTLAERKAKEVYYYSYSNLPQTFSCFFRVFRTERVGLFYIYRNKLHGLENWKSVIKKTRTYAGPPTPYSELNFASVPGRLI